MVEVDRREEARLSEIARLRAARSESDRVLQELVDDLRETFGVDLCLVSLILSDAQYFRAWSGDLPQGLAETRRDSRLWSVCQRVVETERPLVVPDFLADGRFEHGHFGPKHGFRFYAGAPLAASGGQVIGALCLLDREAREEGFGRRDLTLLQVSARAVVGRLEALGALEREREYRRNVFETANDAIVIFDPESGSILEANRRACEMYRLTRERLVGADAAGLSVDPERGRRHVVAVQAEGAYRGFESVHRRADGALVDVSINSSVIEWQGRPAILSIGRDITERKRAEEALKRSEERFRSLIHNSSDLVSVLSADGTIRYTSPSSERVLGYKPEERVGRKALDDVHPQDADRVVRAMAEMVAGGGPTAPLRYRYRHKDGSWRHLETVGSNLLDDPSVGGIVSNSRDVTERVEAEARLRESEERHRREARELALLHGVRTALSGALDARAVCRATVEAVAGAYGYAQVSAYLLDGGAQDGELVLQHQVGYETVIERVPVTEGVMGRSARTGRPVLVEDVRSAPEFLGAIEGVVSEVCVPLRAGDELLGTLNVESTAGTRLTGDDLRLVEAVGEHAGMAVGRALLHERLREAEERYRTMVESIPAVVYVDRADEVSSAVYVSPQAEAMLGYAPEEWLADPELWVKTLHPDDRGRVFAEDRRALETGDPFKAEYRLLAKDGRAVWVRDEAVMRVGGDGEPYWQGVLSDITARKEAEERLRGSERRFRSVVQNSSEIVTIVDPDGALRYASPAFERVFGYGPEEAAGMNVLDHVHPEDLPRVLEATERTLKEPGIGRNVAEYRFRHRDGTWRHVEAVGTYLLDEPSIRGVVVNARDVTARKEAEKRLKESEAELRALFAAMKDVVVMVLDEEGRYLRVAPTDPALLYLPPGELVGKTLHEVLPAEKADDLLGSVREALGGRRTVRTEYSLTLDGREVWFEGTVAPLAGDSAVFVGRDLTRRKRAEEALKESERHFRTVVESLAEGLLMTDLDDVVFGANSRITELTGYAREQLVGRRAHELLLPPGRWEEMRRRYERRGRGLSGRYELSLRRKDGSSFRAEVKATPYRDARGEVVGTVGAISDVTDRHEAAEALKRSEARFRQLFEQSVDALVVHDGEGRILDCNSQACRSFGYSRDEMLALNIKDLDPHLLSGGEREDLEKNGGTLWQRALAGDPGVLSRVIRTEIRRKDGSVYPAEVRVGGVGFGGPGERAILASTRDVTERRRLEARLEHLALHDSLTGLPNRRLFDDRLRQALARTHRTGRQVAVLFIDLDGFKTVNDSLGHQAGDRVLVTASERLRHCLRPEDTAARLGGDEFTVLLEGTSKNEALRVAERIQDSLRAPFFVGDRETRLSASVGVATGSSPDTPEKLMREADRAMYRQKNRGAAGPPTDPDGTQQGPKTP